MVSWEQWWGVSGAPHSGALDANLLDDVSQRRAVCCCRAGPTHELWDRQFLS
jgi:hypothetical protein